MADTIKATVDLERIGDHQYRAQPFFERARAGNAQPIAYGGIVMAQSIKAAFMSIDPTSPHHLFSVQGSYLSPSSTDVPTTFTVQDLRTTRSMLTRLVTASQDLPSSSGSKPQNRKTLVVILDFHVPEPPFLEYHKRLMYPGTYLSPGEVESSTAIMSKMASPELLAVFKKQFDLPLRMFEHRPVPSSTGAQNGLGFLVGMKTSQDGKELVDRTNTNWVKAQGSLDTYAERCAAIGFIMDEALSFLPLALSSIPLTSARAASTMDFSLRFFTPPPEKMDESWLLHEQNTERASDGRSFSVGRMFTEQGVEFARMSQVSILRGPAGGAGVGGRAKL